MQEFWSLAPLGFQDSLANFQQQQAQLKLLIDEFHRNQDKSLAWRLKCYEALDLQFDALECGLALKLIESNNDPAFLQQQESMRRLIEILAIKTDGLIDEALTILDDAALPDWLSALRNKNEVFIAEHYVTGLVDCLTIDGLNQLIMNAKRLTDGSLALLKQRFSDIKDKKDVDRQLSKSVCFKVTQEYFNQLISNNSKLDGSISLKQLREIERAPWEQFRFSISEGVGIVSEAFATIDEQYGEKVQRAYSEGRIRLLTGGGAPMCMDTPSGSYIQLDYLGDVESLILLAHECGHLVHQETVRDVYTLKQDISPLLSEAIALFFERYVADYWFEKRGLFDVLTAWQKRQEIEWYHRHRLLALFELCLYDFNRLNKSNVDELWLSLNQDFFPAQIEFDIDFLESWQELTHIINSPFYYLIYPQAFSMVSDLSIRRVISQCSYS